MRRSGEICGAYGGRISHDYKDYRIEYSDDGNSCTYHRVTYVSTGFIGNVKSSETSWIAVQGKDHICLVTLDVDGETPDLFSTFSYLPVPEAIGIAIIAFRHLLSRDIMPNELKILVAGKDSGTTMSLPIDRTKTFLDVSHGVAESEKTCGQERGGIDIRSALFSAVSNLQDKGMGSLETSDSGHCRNVNETGYHRRTHISDDGQSVQIVKSSETSWIAVQGQEALCFVNCGTALEKPDLIKFFDDPCFHTKAIVSVALGSNDVQGGSGTGVSIADDNEKSAVNFLVKSTSKCSTFTYKETLQTAIIAHRHLCPEISKANRFEIYVLRKGEQNFRVFSVRDIYALADFISEATFESGDLGSSQGPDVGNQETGSQKLETSHMKRRISYNRETQIWCGGWDSKLLCSFGLSWIAVQGKDSVCVVTQDEVDGDEMFWENLIYHMIANELFGIDYYIDRWSKKSSLARPFAAVSVFVDFGEVNKERSHAASRAEIKAVEFLAKKLKEISDFTYETTVQTAIYALLCLTEKDLHAKEIKAYVFRKGELPTTDIIAELPINEIEEHLRQGMMNPPKHLILPEEDSASSSSKRTKL